MGRSRSRSPRYRDRERRRRSRSPRRRSRSPRRRRRSRSPLGDSSRRPRSPGRGAMFGRGGFDEKRKRDDGQFKTPHDAQLALTLGGSLGVNRRKKKKKPQSKPTLAPIQPEDITDEDKRMQEIMGFSGFDTTKGKKVGNNDVYAINRKVERKYRQYMNRKGGFNRPLDFMQ